VKDYDAVWAGCTVANGLLGRLWDRVPPKYATKLAAYVVYQVKTSVKDCGLGTDIATVQRGMLTGVSPGGSEGLGEHLSLLCQHGKKRFLLLHRTGNGANATLSHTIMERAARKGT
jgi:hypothetical protein